VGYYEKEVASNLAKKHKTTDPYELAHILNVNVIEWDLHPDILGFYKYEKNNKWIFLNANAREREKEITCCHELGHVVLHPRDNTPHLRRSTLVLIDKLERAANLFAIELLMSDKDWYTYVNEFQTLDAISNQTGIPKELLVLKYQKTMGC